MTQDGPLNEAPKNVTDSAPVSRAPLAGRTVALCVTGSIAAYKAVEVARLLLRAGARVLPVMTASAARFVGPVTLAGICGEAAATDMWDPSFAGELHIKLAERADLVAIVPATADVLARLAQGRADDLVTALALCARGPVLAAPAMHPRMWDHPATARNVADLSAQARVTLVGPVRGEVASGDEGTGRMADPAAIVAAATALLQRAPSAPSEPARDLAGVRVLVTAGPTLEDVDPVRFLGNRSSGKMGFALAARAAARGADVTLVAGPVHLATPPGVRRVDVRGALDMRAALWAAMLPDLSGVDVLIMAAAVADHRPAEVATTKIKKSDASGANAMTTIQLVKNPDLLAEIGAARAARTPHPSEPAAPSARSLPVAPVAPLNSHRPVLVGFAVETAGGAALVAYAERKLREKRVDMIVCNEAADSFGHDDSRVGLVTAPTSLAQLSTEFLPRASKSALADTILARVRDLL
jgi:phosphopantothenoylcysteine decarboxylase/phosphopantothenate--cysteine ligase